MYNLLAEGSSNGWLSSVLIGVLLLAVVAMFFLSGRKNKAKQKEYAEQIAAIKPGNKVKTAGGICGIVVEVCDEDDTVIIETGSEVSGRSYVKMAKEMIYQTDAKGPTQIAREQAEAERKAAKEAAKEEKAAAPAEAEVVPAAEQPAEDTPAEEPKAEESKTEEK